MNANKTHNSKRLVALLAVLVVCMLSLVTVAYAYNATYTTTVDEQDDVQLVSDASYVTISGSLAYPTANDDNQISITTAAEYTTSTTSSGTTYTVASAEYSVDNDHCSIEVGSGSAYLTVFLGKITLTNHSSAAVTVALSADGAFVTTSSTTTCAFDLNDRAVSDSILFKVSDASDYATQFEIAAPTIDSSNTIYGTVIVGVYVSAPLASAITTDGSSKTTDAYLPAIKGLVISAEDVSGNVSGLQGKTASVNITAACKDGSSTATAPVTVSFSKVPSDAANLTASYTTNSITNTVTLSLGLTKSDGTGISDLDGTATVTATLSGDYSGYKVIYYSTSDSTSAQPTGVSAVHDSSADTTTVTFTTTHFSDFAVYKPASGTDSDGNAVSYFPVASEDDIRAAINASLNVQLAKDMNCSKSISVSGLVYLNLNQNKVNFSSNYGFIVNNNATMYVAGNSGSIVASYCAIWAWAGSTLQIDGGTYSGKYTIMIYPDVNNNNNNEVKSVTISNEEITGTVGIWASRAGANQITIEDTKITTTSLAIYLGTVNNATLTNVVATSSSDDALDIKSGNVTISGGTYTGAIFKATEGNVNYNGSGDANAPVTVLDAYNKTADAGETIVNIYGASIQYTDQTSKEPVLYIYNTPQSSGTNITVNWYTDGISNQYNNNDSVGFGLNSSEHTITYNGTRQSDTSSTERGYNIFVRRVWLGFTTSV